MASQPPELPESIVLGSFAGVTNTVARHRLQPGELESAINVDIDDRGQVRRRRGRELVLAGNFHSVRNVGEQVLGVKDGVLGRVLPSMQFQSFGHAVGPQPLSFTQVADTIYFASESTSGKLERDTISAWGSDAGGRWVSPVITPTETLGQVFGKLLTPPPTAQEIAYYKGRIYLAAGRYLWATELWLYDYIDGTRNFLQFEEDITMLAAVGDGLYVGTVNGLWFLKGTLSSGFAREHVLDAGVLRGSAVAVSTTDAHPNARNSPMAEGGGVMFVTQRGICSAFDGGQVFDLTRGRVAFPQGQSAAALYRDDSGVSSYVAVVDSAGGPAANARIGDYVDAEIVRRGG